MVKNSAMSTKAYRIIVVDDDPELRSLLTRFLAEHGFDTTWLRRAIGDSGDDPTFIITVRGVPAG